MATLLLKYCALGGVETKVNEKLKTERKFTEVYHGRLRMKQCIRRLTLTNERWHMPIMVEP